MNDALDALCRAKVGQTEDWAPYLYTVVPMPPAPAVGVQVTGANFRVVTRGPTKGRRKWGSENKITLFVTVAEWDACFPKSGA